mgnify:CR=1 FL=1
MQKFIQSTHINVHGQDKYETLTTYTANSYELKVDLTWRDKTPFFYG